MLSFRTVFGWRNLFWFRRPTARGSETHQIEGLETGADDYVSKPFSMEVLQLRIRNLLESRRKLRERFDRELSVEPSEITVTSADEEFLQRAIALVEEHMDEAEFGVGDLADGMHLARNTLLLKLRALVDQTPHEFIRTLRLKRARQLLGQGTDSVAEVAFLVGFEEPTNFSRSFKKTLRHDSHRLSKKPVNSSHHNDGDQHFTHPDYRVFPTVRIFDSTNRNRSRAKKRTPLRHIPDSVRYLLYRVFIKRGYG
jgi:AraC-like DNA-binding protein